MMMGNLYGALKQAGADEESAQRAAEEVAGFENRIGDRKTELTAIRGELFAAEVDGRLQSRHDRAIVVRLFLTGQ